MSNAYTYSPNDGFWNIGVNDLDFNKVKFEQQDAAVKVKRGTRGEVVFNVAKSDQIIKVTASVPASSRANFLLNALYDAMIAGGLKMPSSFTNINGGASYAVAQGMLEKKAGGDYSEESGDCEWVYFGPGKIVQNGAIV